MPQYVTKAELGERVKRLVEEYPGSQEDLAEEHNWSYTGISKAKDLEKHEYYTATAIKIIQTLENVEIEGTFYKITDNMKTS